ncbi:MAG: arginine N-succinyltransferase [Phycisphaerales bacterium]|nr:arginine N-succinyltransferase [Phycisphaerales bacterium]
MFYIRRAVIEDLSTLLKLAKMVHFINLPADRDIISQKVIRSRNSFNAVAAGTAADAATIVETKPPRQTSGTPGMGEITGRSELFMFVLADTDSSGCLGTSQLISCMGNPESPNVCLRLERREMFSTSLQTGTSHTVARLYLDPSAPTEIGGLVLQPSYRGHPQKLGRFLSIVRFHFMGLHRSAFRDEILAEMMGQITPDGHNLFWDFFGRRFIPLSYIEADRLCQYSREFIMSLLPRDDIYLSLLPPEARAGVGQVGPETVPARRLLEKLGFEFRGFVDPFDAGPYLHATTDTIPLLKATFSATLGEPVAASKCKTPGIISILHDDGDFIAVNQPCLLDDSGHVRVTREVLETLKAEPGQNAGVSDLTVLEPKPPVPIKEPKKNGRKSDGPPPRKRARSS